MSEAFAKVSAMVDKVEGLVQDPAADVVDAGYQLLAVLDHVGSLTEDEKQQLVPRFNKLCDLVEKREPSNGR